MHPCLAKAVERADGDLLGPVVAYLSRQALDVLLQPARCAAHFGAFPLATLPPAGLFPSAPSHAQQTSVKVTSGFHAAKHIAKCSSLWFPLTCPPGAFGMAKPPSSCRRSLPELQGAAVLVFLLSRGPSSLASLPDWSP